MEEAHQDQMSKVIHKIKECELERSRIEVKSEEKLQTLQYEKKMTEQAILAKLDTKAEQLRRMEEHVEELREIAQSAKLITATMAGNVRSSSHRILFNNSRQKR
jgi:K+/H+ antiporter YhaU regulatory subunit KhtT